jgi:hypothetical protein
MRLGVLLSLEGEIPIERSLEGEIVRPEGIVAVNVEVEMIVAVVEVEMIEMTAAKVEVVKGANEILSAEAANETADRPPGKRSSRKRSKR